MTFGMFVLEGSIFGHRGLNDRPCGPQGITIIVTRKTDSMHHHHPEGVVYRSLCLKSSTVAVSEMASMRLWCIESLFPDTYGRVPNMG